jgi:aminopeptidase YwaD
MTDRLTSLVEEYLHRLCSVRPDRHVGSAGNREATAFFAETVSAFGFEVERTPLDAMEWDHGEALFSADGERFDALVGPYSLSCDVEAPLVPASCVEDLETESIRGAIVLAHGELAREPLMPKGFVFYNPERHKRIYRALEEHEPLAVVAATARNPHLAGGLYPFPLIEDGDFDVPSAYMTDAEGDRLLALGPPGRATLRFESRRIPASAEHVVAKKRGDRPGRIVAFGHIDGRKGIPAALDNATGPTILLGLASLLQDYSQGPDIELVPLNGEDYWAAPGQMQWVRDNEGRFDDIVLGINADAAGWTGHKADVSLYGLPDDLACAAREALGPYPRLQEGPAWYQSDHGIFLAHERPTIAITSEDLLGLATEITHTERDRPELVDVATVTDICRYLRDVITRLE